MELFDRVLCPIDLFDCCDHAFRAGSILSERYGARMTLLHVAQLTRHTSLGFAPGRSYERSRQRILRLAEDRLRALAAAASLQGPELEVVVRQGEDVAAMIVGFAEAAGTDIIVMGTHGRRGIAKLMFGSVTEDVIRGSRCPILVARPSSSAEVPDVGAAHHGGEGRILVCVDGSGRARSALLLAASLAADFEATLTVRHLRAPSVGGPLGVGQGPPFDSRTRNHDRLDAQLRRGLGAGAEGPDFGLLVVGLDRWLGESARTKLGVTALDTVRNCQGPVLVA